MQTCLTDCSTRGPHCGLMGWLPAATSINTSISVCTIYTGLLMYIQIHKRHWRRAEFQRPTFQMNFKGHQCSQNTFGILGIIQNLDHLSLEILQDLCPHACCSLWLLLRICPQSWTVFASLIAREM